VAPEDPANIPDSDALPATTTASVASPPVAAPIQWIKGGHERVRVDSQTNVILWQPEVAVEVGYEGCLEKIIQRAKWVQFSSFGPPLPTGCDTYGSTEQLFTLIRKTFAEQALLSHQASSLLAYWSLSCWFPDALPIAPCLVIIGSAEEGDRVLHTLRNLCRNPLLLIGVNIPDLKTIYWDPPSYIALQRAKPDEAEGHFSRLLYPAGLRSGSMVSVQGLIQFQGDLPGRGCARWPETPVESAAERCLSDSGPDGASVE
jgi:hypothetical protein